VGAPSVLPRVVRLPARLTGPRVHIGGLAVELVVVVPELAIDRIRPEIEVSLGVVLLLADRDHDTLGAGGPVDILLLFVELGEAGGRVEASRGPAAHGNGPGQESGDQEGSLAHDGSWLNGG